MLKALLTQQITQSYNKKRITPTHTQTSLSAPTVQLKVCCHVHTCEEIVNYDRVSVQERILLSLCACVWNKNYVACELTLIRVKSQGKQAVSEQRGKNGVPVCDLWAEKMNEGCDT